MLTALIFQFAFGKNESSPIKKIVHNYLYLDADIQTTVEALSSANVTEICAIFTHENSKIYESSKTHEALAKLFFHDIVFSRVKETFFSDPKTFIDQLKELLLSFKDSKCKGFLKTILDKSDIEDSEKLEVVKILVMLFPESGWQSIIAFPSKTSNFATIKESYFGLLNSALNETSGLETVNIESIVFKNEDRLFFRNLVFDENDLIAKNGLVVCSYFDFADIETTIEDRISLTRNSISIENACLKTLLKIHSKESCKVIYHYIKLNSKNNSSSTLQFAFKVLNEIGVAGKPYIVLLARSEEPFVQVMAKSYLHTSNL
ncbi:MAG: hypothetical protein KAH01_00035 [Caldisericia bacterium]|nr:hypothetical protein [Caldisericia bacterium]